jgi:hypothetical protein
MATITLSLISEVPQVEIKADLSEIHRVVTVMGAILPGLRLVGGMSPREQEDLRSRGRPESGGGNRR